MQQKIIQNLTSRIRDYMKQILPIFNRRICGFPIAGNLNCDFLLSFKNEKEVEQEEELRINVFIMKVLIAEKLSDCGVKVLDEGGHTLVNQFVSGDALKDAVAEEKPQILLVRSTKVTAAIMDACPTLEDSE